MLILFKGELLPETDQASVISNFAALFGVPPNKVAPYFNGQAVFFRRKLDAFTAQRYYRNLSAVGAKVFLGREPTVPLDRPDIDTLKNLPLAQCPICQTNQVFDKTCVLCQRNELRTAPRQPAEGSSFPRHHAANTFIAKSGSEVGSEYLPPELKPLAAKARKALWMGCLLMLASLIFEKFLADYRMFEFVTLWKGETTNLGIAPYLLATLLITYGCLNYARLKGYPGVWGLLGLSNLMGVGILILLPSRRQPRADKPYWDKARISSVLLIVFCLCWMIKFLGERHYARDFLNQPLPLQIADHRLTAANGDGLPATEADLLEEEQNLQRYIQEAYDLLSAQDLNLNTTAKVADRIYGAISNLSVWLNYQQFGYRTHELEIPLCFRPEEIEAKIRTYFDDVRLRNGELQNEIVNRIHVDWTMLYVRQDHPDQRVIDDFRRQLSTSVYQPIVHPWDPKMQETTISERVEAAMEEFDTASQIFEVKFDEDSSQLWILLESDLIEPLAGKTVCFGIWQKPGAVRWSRKKGTHRKTVTVFTRIGGNLPGKFLPPDFGNSLSIAARQVASR